MWWCKPYLQSRVNDGERFWLVEEEGHTVQSTPATVAREGWGTTPLSTPSSSLQIQTTSGDCCNDHKQHEITGWVFHSTYTRYRYTGIEGSVKNAQWGHWGVEHDHMCIALLIQQWPFHHWDSSCPSGPLVSVVGHTGRQVIPRGNVHTYVCTTYV